METVQLANSNRWWLVTHSRRICACMCVCDGTCLWVYYGYMGLVWLYLSMGLLWLCFIVIQS